MTAKPVVPREQAVRDIEDAVDHYYREAGERVALGFIDEVERAFRAIARSPAAGSPRYAHELGLPGLRVRRLKRYPYLVFCVERPDCLDVWRGLHGRRDIPAWMTDPDRRS
ncbi:MAG TPA: type II toxin-antitoxin system RelE/ParE family toxin [Caulobacteraceae bacterium]|jgi:toxin ParE1/3/4